MTALTRALQCVDAAGAAAGLLDRRFNLQAMVRRAQRNTGLSDYGDVEFIEPLRHLLKACSDESALTLVGRMATRWDVIRFLTNLLRMRDAEKQAPSITAEPIERPIFITGLPRSGTTFLHRLLLADPAHRAPLVWQTIYPYPEPGMASNGPDPRPGLVARQLRMFEKLAPDFRALHPLDADEPQECSEITAHVFRSLRFDTNYFIPSYRAWMDADVDRHLPAYRFHKRFLQHLQHQDRVTRPPGQWVLKCPEHVFALRAIRAVYPDARLVFVHRDPLKVLVSQSRLTDVLRRPFSRKLDPVRIGRDESARWLDGTRRMIEIGDDAGLPDAVCHVHHIDLITDPVNTAENVYRHFGMRMSADAVTGMEAFVRAKPNGGYGAHHYDAGYYGLDEGRERDRFRPYMLRFGISPERPRPTITPPAPQRHAVSATPG